LEASLASGEPTEVAYEPSFVDGIGGRSLLPEMWPLVRDLLEGSVVVSPGQAADAVRLLAERNHVVAEGAAGTAVAAALAGTLALGEA
jgi:threonine dehydratase